jgi:hypothetical protein
LLNTLGSKTCETDSKAIMTIPIGLEYVFVRSDDDGEQEKESINVYEERMISKTYHSAESSQADGKWTSVAFREHQYNQPLPQLTVWNVTRLDRKPAARISTEDCQSQFLPCPEMTAIEHQMEESAARFRELVRRSDQTRSFFRFREGHSARGSLS